MERHSYLRIALGPLLGLVAGAWLSTSGQPANLCITAGVAIWMAVWWINEAVSIYATALLPAVLFPLLGVMDMKALAPAYLPQILFLFIGGFMLAFALERWNLHKRIALRVILSVGVSPSRLLLGVMLASYLLSMWITNTATTMLLLPAVLAVAGQTAATDSSEGSRLVTALLLGLAFSASIGGTATIIGTVPNLYFVEFFHEHYPESAAITFPRWMLFGVPVGLVMLAASYYLIRWRYLRNLHLNADMEYCRKAYQELGPMNYEEKMLSAVFGLTVLLWFFSRDVSFGSFTIKSWANLLHELPIPLLREPGFVRESTVAMLAALLLFVIPSRQEPGRALLVWREARKMPIGVLFLFGGGFVLAKAVGDSGLSTWLAEHMQLIAFLPPWVVIVLACLFMTFFTELTSNTASVVLLLPILQAMALNMDLPPVALLLPVTFSASFAFMLPVATPPNAIVFGSEQLRVQDMVRTGIWLNLVGVAIMLLAVFTLGRWIFGM